MTPVSGSVSNKPPVAIYMSIFFGKMPKREFTTVWTCLSFSFTSFPWVLSFGYIKSMVFNNFDELSIWSRIVLFSESPKSSGESVFGKFYT